MYMPIIHMYDVHVLVCTSSMQACDLQVEEMIKMGLFNYIIQSIVQPTLVMCYCYK